MEHPRERGGYLILSGLSMISWVLVLLGSIKD